MSESGLGSPAAVSTPSRLSLFLDRAGLQGFPWVSAIVLYTISWGWILIVRGSLWAHDWDGFAIPEFAKFNNEDYGFAPWTKYEIVLFQNAGSSIFHFVVFGSFFVSAIFLYGVLTEFPSLNSTARNYLILFFLILPFNTSRVALMVFKYATAYLLFFVGWYLVVKIKSSASRFIGALVFFLSFQMHSLLFFFVLPIAHTLTKAKSKDLHGFIVWAKTHAFLLCAPLFYVLARYFYWPEHGQYHNLNISSVSNSFTFIFTSTLALMVVLVFANKTKGEVKKNLHLVVLGMLSAVVGILPYVLYRYFEKTQMTFVVSYLTTFLGRSNWNSRHLILQPLGISLAIVGAVSAAIPGRLRAQKRVMNCLIGICLMFNLGFGFEFIVDNSKQREVIETMVQLGDNGNKDQLQFIDQTTLLNARGQKMYPNSWSGLVWRSYGIDSARRWQIETSCTDSVNARLVLIQGPETHWQALKNWVRDRNMGFKVTVDDTPGACKPEMVTPERVSGAIPILFYFTGSKN